MGHIHLPSLSRRLSTCAYTRHLARSFACERLLAREDASHERMLAPRGPMDEERVLFVQPAELFVAVLAELCCDRGGRVFPSQFER